MSIYQKMIQAQAKVSGVKKDSKGYNYNYESLDSIISLLHPVMADMGLFIQHTVVSGDVFDPVTGEIKAIGGLQCVTKVFDEKGESVESYCPILGSENILAKGNPMQGIGSAITYARRYNLKNLFNLYATDDDAASVGERKASSKQLEFINNLLEQMPATFEIDKFYDWLGTSNLQDLTDAQARKAITGLKSKVEK